MPPTSARCVKSFASAARRCNLTVDAELSTVPRGREGRPQRVGPAHTANQTIKSRISVPSRVRPGRRARQRQWSRTHCDALDNGCRLINSIGSMPCDHSGRATPTSPGQEMKAETDRAAAAAGRSPDVAQRLARFPATRGHESGRQRWKRGRRESPQLASTDLAHCYTNIVIKPRKGRGKLLGPREIRALNIADRRKLVRRAF